MSKHKLEVGEVYPIPFNTVGGVVTVNCVVLDTRRAYGRVEWKVAPRDGEGSTWMQENSILGGVGARVDASGQKRSADRRKAKAKN